MANATLASVCFKHTPPPIDNIIQQPVDYWLSPIDIEDLEYLEMQVRGDIMRAGRASLPTNLSQEQETKLMRPIIECALDFVITEGDNLKRTNNVSGGVHTAYCMLRHRHPDMTLSKVREILMHSPKEMRAARLVLEAGQVIEQNDDSEQAKKELGESENQQQQQASQIPAAVK